MVLMRVTPLLAAMFYCGSAAFAGLGPVEPDAFEPDDTPEEASWIGVDGPSQLHNFHVEGDEDWMRFFTPGGEIITIETFDLGPNSLTNIELFDGTGSALLESDTSSIIRMFPNEGFFLVRVTHALNGFGEGTEYNIRVIRETGALPGTITGTVFDSVTFMPIGGSRVRLPLFGGLSADTDSNGIYIMSSLPPRLYTVEAMADGYASSALSVNVTSGALIIANFFLTSASFGDVNGDGEVDASDLQLVINAVLGLSIGAYDADVNGDGVTDALDVQMTINAILGIL